MFDLFRFVMLRPPVRRAPHEVFSTTEETPLQRQLGDDRSGPHPGTAMEQTANAFLDSDRFVGGAAALAFGAAYETLDASLRATPPESLGALLDDIEAAFALAAPSLVERPTFIEDRKRLADSLIAAKLGTPRLGLPVETLARNLRLIALVQRAAQHDARLDDPAAIAAALDVSLSLPDGLLPLPTSAPPAPEAADHTAADREERRKEARRRYHELVQAADFLRDLPADQLATHTAEQPAHPDAPSELREAENDLLREIRELRHEVFARSAAAGRAGPEMLTSAVRVVPAVHLMVRREALDRAPAAVLAGFRAAGVDMAATSLPGAIDRINTRLRELTPLVAEDSLVQSNVAMLGGQFFHKSLIPDLMTADGRRTDA